MVSFHAFFGRPPEVAWFAPGRVNLIGEHTDYNDGFVLPFALPLGVRAMAARRPDLMLVLRSRQVGGHPVRVDLATLGPDRPSGWAAYPAGVAWALLRAGYPLGGADVLVDGDVPLGAGLSSSAALECAVACALNALFDIGIGPDRLAALCTQAENEVVGMPCGVMDQLVAMHGREGHAVFIDTRNAETTHVPLDLATAGLSILVVNTGAAHVLVGSAYALRRADCEAAARALGLAALRDASPDAVDGLRDPRLRRRASHVVSEDARVLEAVRLLHAGRLAELGPILSASHASLRDDFEVSSPRLDTTVEAMLDGGALGARLTGAGFGGCAIALVASGEVDGVRATVEEAFADSGWPAPASLVASPAQGAHPVPL
jgi:galactokinase